MQRHPADDALAGGELDPLQRLGAAALRGAEEELARALLAEQDRAGLDADELDRARQKARQQAVEIERRRGLALDLEQEVELGDALPQLILRRQERHVLAEDVEVQLGVLDGDAGVRGDGGQERLVVEVERPQALVEHLHDADGAPLVIGHRHAQDRARAKAGRLVDGLVEARIGVGVGDVHRRRRLRHPAGDAFAGLEADGGDGAALRDLRLEVGAVVGDEVDGGALGVEEIGDLLEQDHEQAIEVERGARARDRARARRRSSCARYEAVARAPNPPAVDRRRPTAGSFQPARAQRVVVLAAQVAELVQQGGADLLDELVARGDRALEVLAVDDDGARLRLGRLADGRAAEQAEDGRRQRRLLGRQIGEVGQIGGLEADPRQIRAQLGLSFLTSLSTSARNSDAETSTGAWNSSGASTRARASSRSAPATSPSRSSVSPR